VAPTANHSAADGHHVDRTYGRGRRQSHQECDRKHVDVWEEVHIALMGRNTLRFHSVIPAAGNSPGCLQLSRSRASILLDYCDFIFLSEARFLLIHSPAVAVFDFGSGSPEEIRSTFTSLEGVLSSPQFFDNWKKIDAKRDSWTEYSKIVKHLHLLRI
jgi:hypothetical protein